MATESASAARFGAVLLDFDGTVVDTLELILTSFRTTIERHQGRTLPDAVWLAGVGTPLLTQLRAIARDEDEAQAMVETYRAESEAQHEALARPFEGMQACLEQLHAREVPLAIVTSKGRRGVDRAFQQFDLERLFGAVVTADDVVNAKPAPEPVLTAARLLEVPADRCLMVGDSPHDLTSGRTAGATVAAAGWGAFDAARLRAGSPDHWLETPRDLIALALPP